MNLAAPAKHACTTEAMILCWICRDMFRSSTMSNNEPMTVSNACYHLYFLWFLCIISAQSCLSLAPTGVPHSCLLLPALCVPFIMCGMYVNCIYMNWEGRGGRLVGVYCHNCIGAILTQYLLNDLRTSEHVFACIIIFTVKEVKNLMAFRE